MVPRDPCPVRRGERPYAPVVGSGRPWGSDGCALTARGVMAVLFVVGGAFGALGWSASAGAGTPDPAPGDVILPASLPGFTAAAPGVFNGPLSTATLMTYTTDPDLLNEIEKGAVSGYLRSWGHTYPDGTGDITDLVIKFPNAAQAAAYLDVLPYVVTGQNGVTGFVATMPKGATGYTAYGLVVTKSTDFAVSFGRGDYASFLLAATPGGIVTKTQIEQLAQAQWVALPFSVASPAVPTTAVGASAVPTSTTLPSSVSASPSSGGIEAVVVLFLVILVIAFLVLWAVDAFGRRRRARRDGPGDGPDPEPPPEPLTSDAADLVADQQDGS